MGKSNHLNHSASPYESLNTKIQETHRYNQKIENQIEFHSKRKEEIEQICRLVKEENIKLKQQLQDHYFKSELDDKKLSVKNQQYG